MTSSFSFRPHPIDQKEIRIHALVHVHDRETGEFIGMVNPIRDGGYVLRNREGVRLSAAGFNGFDDEVYTSRETAAAILRQRMRQVTETIENRAHSVTAGCPNTWHNSVKYRQVTPCPDCPSQPGLKMALAAVKCDEARQQISALIHQGDAS